jgi:type I restriction enzyme S subunit
MTTDIQKYPAYKDSGVEWIGEIPKNWKAERLASILINVAERNRTDLPLLSITREKGVILRDLDNEEENHNFVPDDLSNYKVLRKGQLGMNKMKAWQGSYGISEQDGIVSPAYFIFQLRNDIDSRYFHLAIRSRLYISFFGSASDGVRIGQWDLSRDRMKNIPFLIPPIEEQTAIASFLDRKTALIDQAIDIKQKQIELLKERRQILIHKAVTRGIGSLSGVETPNVKMKDSGVEWIGEIPEGWEVKKLRYLANCFPSNVDKHSKPNEKEVRLCNYTDVYKNDYITDDMELMIATASDEQIAKFTLRKGDIVITKDSETASDIAVPTFIKEELTNVVCGYHLAVIRTYLGSYSKYLFQALKTKLFNAQFEVCSNGITRVGLGNSDLRNGYFLLPPEQEQNKIAEFIEKGVSKIATAISLKEQEIEKLKEYKATLINSAVTGKIKVC